VCHTELVEVPESDTIKGHIEHSRDMAGFKFIGKLVEWFLTVSGFMFDVRSSRLATTNQL